MAKMVFHSRLPEQLGAFIEQKHLLGYPYKSSGNVLKRFDAMLSSKFPDAGTVTKEICDEWVRENSDVHQNTLTRSITPIRQFTKYLAGTGMQVYIIPRHIGSKQIKYQAHIFTSAEKVAFFRSVDSCAFSAHSPTKCYAAPVMFRMLYCCGLREKEVLDLTVDDVGLEDGKVMIRESKGWKARTVFMSQDMLLLCRRYDRIIGRMLPGRQAFFPNRHGRHLRYHTLNHWFHEFWDCLPESVAPDGIQATPHCFRHTYAVDRLNSWVREGRDISTMYAYLSEYMGHVQYSSTDYYLQLVSEFYPEMEKLLSGVNKNILPEVCHENEN